MLKSLNWLILLLAGLEVELFVILGLLLANYKSGLILKAIMRNLNGCYSDFEFESRRSSPLYDLNTIFNVIFKCQRCRDS